MSHSLKSKLLIAVMTPLALGWTCWLGGQHFQMTRQQKGHDDLFLQEVSEQILLSMPGTLDALDEGPRLRLPTQPSRAGKKFETLRYQVWILGRRTPVVASNGAPMQPLRADFKPGFVVSEVAGEPWRVYAVTDATGRIQVQAGMSQSAMKAELAHWVKISLWSGVGILLVLGASVGFAIHWSLRPMNRLRQDMALRDPHDLAPLPASGLPREIRPLVDSFNLLLGRLSEAMRGERQFLADAAHELRTPLAALLTQTQVAMRAGSQADAQAALTQLAQGIQRTSRLAQQLLDSARVDASPLREDRPVVALPDVVTMVAREFESMATRRQQVLAIHAEPASVRGDLDDLGILVRNLLDNAVRYSGEQARIEIACGGDEQTAWLVVRDSGPGVPVEERERIFERFFRGSQGNGERGSGIGLSLVDRIARAHDARITVEEGIAGRGFGCRVEFVAAPDV
ncbi:ATP-binding protein [Pseudoxanthomonas sp. PXM02]|uniref:ATP-binding protein n=1 Tax=Pseudoxanthomonas sp. PXM02 TaxID=2769294 RepID=UPI001786B252|nr:ATP-binding protein [Pseudoxanthomonas sp. PXM02]MBD9479934.1 two-component sensor histidine kinase [Pseudoxanthomonas sp. PXM02]